MIEMPVPNINGNSFGGTSSSPKNNSQPDNSILAKPRPCPDTSTSIAESVAECTEHSNSDIDIPFFRSAMSLMRALDSDHPLATETTSSSDAEIKALSFLLNGNDAEAQRLYPLFRDTLKRAQTKRKLRPPFNTTPP